MHSGLCVNPRMVNNAAFRHGFAWRSKYALDVHLSHGSRLETSGHAGLTSVALASGFVFSDSLDFSNFLGT